MNTYTDSAIEAELKFLIGINDATNSMGLMGWSVMLGVYKMMYRDEHVRIDRMEEALGERRLEIEHSNSLTC